MREIKQSEPGKQTGDQTGRKTGEKKRKSLFS